MTFDGNGNTGGSVPVDPASPYEYGSTVTVPGQGSLTRMHYRFMGWNTAANGTGTAYDENDTFAIAGNETLFAQWNVIITEVPSLSEWMLILLGLLLVGTAVLRSRFF